MKCQVEYEKIITIVQRVIFTLRLNRLKFGWKTLFENKTSEPDPLFASPRTDNI